MVLTKEELIGSLQKEVRILLHLAGKVEKSMVDYRPAPKQRSTLELLQYLAIMGPTQIAGIRGGVYDRPTMMALWNPAEVRAKTFDFDQAVAEVGKLAGEYPRLLNDWTDADFRSEVNLFGNIFTRGSMLVNQVLSGHAAYRMQLFLYLKACGREELNTVNLWVGADTMNMGA